MTDAIGTEPGSDLRSLSASAVAAALIRRAQRMAVMAHVNPDADAIGAVVGLSLGLQSLGKDVTAALSDPIPEYARFLAGSEKVGSSLDTVPYDLLICLDAADIERIGSLYADFRPLFDSTPVLNIDHHRTNPLYGTVNFVDAAASSTSELCYHVLLELGVALEPVIANALLFGIVGDTGSFQNGATTPSAMKVAAELLRLGGDNQKIAYQLFESKTFAAARLWGRVMSTIELDRERHIVFAFLTQDMLREEGVSMDETEGMPEYLRGIEEAETAIILKEQADGEIRVSMRSRPTVDVSAIAKALDGGGHRQAAGCSLPPPLATAKQILIDTYDRTHPR